MRCPNCHSKIPDNSNVCMYCGANVSGFYYSYDFNNGSQETYSNGSNFPNRNWIFLKKRSIALCIVFTIITCGIYGLYWLYKMAESINIITNTEDDTSPGLVVLFNVLTCGIYGCYWGYKVGCKLKLFYNQRNSNKCDDSPIWFLVLLLCKYAIYVCGFIAYSLIQDNINQIIETDFQ